jgi:hypothetical protein
MNTTSTFNNNTSGNTSTVPPIKVTDNIIDKINGTNRINVEPEFGRLKRQFDKGNFIQIGNFNNKNYELTYVENGETNDDFKILALPKYSYIATLKDHMLLELPEIQLSRYPMRSRGFIEKYGGSMNNLTVIINKKNKDHATIFKTLGSIDEFNKSSVCKKKQEYYGLIKPYNYNTDIGNNPNTNSAADNHSIKMSFYTKGKMVLTRVTKTHAEDMSVIDEIEGITLDQLALLLSGGVKVSIIASLPYVWSSKIEKKGETQDTEETVNPETQTETKTETETKKTIIGCGTKMKIVAIHVVIPATSNKLSYGKQKGSVIRKVNYSSMTNREKASKDANGYLKKSDNNSFIQELTFTRLVTMGAIVAMIVAIIKWM